MDVDTERIQELIERPGESLSVEIKRWFDPDKPSGIAKIVKTAIALRNYGGGYFVVGFDDKTLIPDSENTPENVKEKFHQDKIQGLISKYSSESFEVNVKFPIRDGQEYPVIVVPSGIKTPVVTKSELPDNNNVLIKLDTVYVRTLTANNTPSTSQATWKDWPHIVEICFDNREADIGRFLRRHLIGLDSEVVRELASAIVKKTQPEPSREELLSSFIEENKKRFESIFKERQLNLPEYGSWEVALILIGDIPHHSANLEFLNLLDSSNPAYTGWPVWVNSRGFGEEEDRPHVIDGVWEAFIVGTGIWGGDLDFMRLDPKGKFYLRRALQDDISESARSPEPFKVLDFGLPIIRTAEAIAVGISFAKAMGCNKTAHGI